jgi:hypothetical protein
VSWSWDSASKGILKKALARFKQLDKIPDDLTIAVAFPLGSRSILFISFIFYDFVSI